MLFRSVLDGSIERGTPLVRNLSHDPSVTVSSLSGDDAGAIVEPSDFAAALAIEKSAETLLVQIPVDTQVSEPILIDRVGASISQSSFERIRIQAGRHSQATVVVHNSGSAALAEDIELELADGAQLTFISLQEWENDATHLGRHQALIGKDAKLTLIEVTLGGATVRLLPRVNFLADRKSTRLNSSHVSESRMPSSA